MQLKRDRDYIRRVIQESKEAASSPGGDADSKLKWNKQENRITWKASVRDGPSKDHDSALNYLNEQRNRKQHMRRNSTGAHTLNADVFGQPGGGDPYAIPMGLAPGMKQF